MAKPSNTSAIEVATKIKWSDWLKFFDGIKATGLSHREIADKAYEKLKDHPTINAGWWSQSVAVAYEQHIGRRKPGQRPDGTYEVSVSKTIDGTMDEVFARWEANVQNLSNFNGISFSNQPSKSQTEKRRHWAVNLVNGTRVNFDVDGYVGKIRIAITHVRLKDSQAADKWRDFWKEFLNDSM